MEKFVIGQRVISAFPGTGKSHFVNYDSSYMPQGFASDSDSSKFDKKDFPNNYIDHIKEKISEGYAFIFVSSHKDVRDALVKNNIDFTLVYPERNLKDEYIERYKKRGSSEQFIQLISDNWDNWLTELEQQDNCKHIQLESEKYLSNTKWV